MVVIQQLEELKKSVGYLHDKPSTSDEGNHAVLADVLKDVGRIKKKRYGVQV